MREKDIKGIRIVISRLGFAILIIAALMLFVRAFTTSLFFQKKDRVNFIFYGQYPTYYSLSTKDGVNYIIYFFPDSRTLVPGGYGYYRLGALGKLVSLEKNRDIFQKAFSSATSTTVDFYFYSPNDEIYYGQDLPNLTNIPPIKRLLFSRSNAGLVNRLYLLLRIISLERSDFLRLNLPTETTKDNQHILKEEDFAKQHQGYFYNKSYREERKNVQIMYTKKYSNALLISRMLEGNGVRIVDIAQTKNTGRCRVIEEGKTFSETARDISRFFKCGLQTGKASVSDIIVELGDSEEEWKIE